MDNYGAELYANIKAAVEQRCVAAVFECGSKLEVENLVDDTELFYINLRHADPAKTKQLCGQVVTAINELVSNPSDEALDEQLRTNIFRLVEHSRLQTYH